MTRPILRTSLCDMLNIEYPIVLAGMGGWGKATPPRLVAAVSEAGGLGVLGGSNLDPEEIRRRIREVQKSQILHGYSEAFVITRSYTGKTARNYKNDIVDAWEQSELDPLPMPYQRVLMEDFMESAIRAGRDDLYSNPAGQIGGMLTTSKPAATIMEELIQGTIATLDNLRHTVQTAVNA